MNLGTVERDGIGLGLSDVTWRGRVSLERRDFVIEGEGSRSWSLRAQSLDGCNKSGSGCNGRHI